LANAIGGHREKIPLDDQYEIAIFFDVSKKRCYPDAGALGNLARRPQPHLRHDVVVCRDRERAWEDGHSHDKARHKVRLNRPSTGRCFTLPG